MQLCSMLPSRCENAAEAVPSTPHSCLTNLCPTHCSHASILLPPIQALNLYSPTSIHSTIFSSITNGIITVVIIMIGDIHW